MAKIAVIETNKGTIKFELFEQESPKTVENFCLLAERGYYDGLTFHRVIKNLLIQGGDPLGNGYGGESAWGGYFEDEIKLNSELYSGVYRRGTVAMANAGPNTNGSQFFIMQTDYPLPPKYTKFGRVIEGIEVVDKITEVPTDEDDTPLEKIIMHRVYVQDSS
jgi:cyclophilin family peptidyl-prolyl cis-trans isomerase